MADTMRADFPDNPCSDCGNNAPGEVYLKHWGPLVPPGEVGYFDQKCWVARSNERDEGFEPRPLGTKPRELTQDGYTVGLRPPELAEDGSFKTPFGVRVYSIVDEDGTILSVDKTTGLLTKDDCNDE